MSVLLFEDSTVQLVWVLVHTVSRCTSSLVTTKSLWPLCYFCWLPSIILECQSSLVLSETVLESIVGVVRCCQSACLLYWWGLPKVSMFASIIYFFGFSPFEYYIYIKEMVYWWNMYKSFCLRTFECNLCVLVHLRPSYTLCLVDTRWLWSLCDFFWIYDIDVHLQISIVLGELVSESIVGVVCCCEWSMSFVLVRLGQSGVFFIDLGFFWL